MDKQKDFEKGWEDYKTKRKQQTEEMIGIIQKSVGGCARNWASLIAEELIKYYQPKIPEGAVLTREELDEVLDTCKCAMVVTDDDGEKYVSLDDYDEYTDRLGKIARQRKVKIEYLEKLLDDRCDRCIERVRKETAEKFAERLKERLKVYLNEDLDFLMKWCECNTTIDETAKEFTGGEYGTDN